MTCRTLIDMMVDNRTGFEQELKRLGADKNITDIALGTFDQLANQAIRLNEACKIMKDDYISEHGEKMWNEFEYKNALKWPRLQLAMDEYHICVSKGKAVGYSAEEE